MSRDLGEFSGASPLDCRVLLVYLEAGIEPRVDEERLVALVDGLPVARVARTMERSHESWS